MAQQIVYAIIAARGGPNGQPIVMESPVDTTLEQLIARAERYKDEYGTCIIVPLPIHVVDGFLYQEKSAGTVTI